MRIPFLMLPLLALAAAAPALAQQDPITGAAVEFFTLRPGGATTTPPQAFGGESCKVAIAAVGAERVWWGRFAGGRYVSTTKGGSHAVPYSRDACFPTRGACESWMYGLKSRYGDVPSYNECRLGWDPSAPVRPWWKLGIRPGF